MDADKAEKAEHRPVERAIEDILILPTQSLRIAVRGWHFSEMDRVVETEGSDHNERDRHIQVNGGTRLPVGHEDEQGLRDEADRQRGDIPKERLHESYVNVGRKLILSI
ncbi:hypothetical protein NGM99_08085 [Mesorhizobium sp. RP14(2022)]|uniref:Uncharacterized protein n=1 Tax=Mesorhizobium liriopis TaxID=2953882 RepID=A0ABT1C4J6_9HYPH|nr:hypothetical protein [Mesorhizobium liriopis]MCO6049750.1 hypothetical protein [Mesorhizobium liriopis]